MCVFEETFASNWRAGGGGGGGGGNRRKSSRKKLCFMEMAVGSESFSSHCICVVNLIVGCLSSNVISVKEWVV